MIRRAFLSFLALAIPVFAFAQTNLRVVTWNVSTYNAGDRINDFKTAIFGVNPANGLSMNPDVFIGQEFMSAAAASGFALDVLNQGNAGGDWAAAPYLTGPTVANSTAAAARTCHESSGRVRIWRFD